MTRKIFLTTILVMGACLCISTMVTAQGQNAAPINSKVETFATFPSAAGTENICQTADGSIYVTGIDERILWKISPAGGVEKFTSVPYMNSLLGVVPSENGFVLTAFGKSSRPPAPATPGAAQAGPQINFSDVDPQILVLDKTGKLAAVIPGKKGEAFNGVARAGDGWYLAADSNAASLWRIDPAKKQIELWLKDDQLAPSGPLPIGANGIKVHDGWVYVSVTASSNIYRVQIGPDGKPQGGLQVFAKGIRADDFDIAKDGSIYAPSGTTMYKISPTGEVSKFLENVPGGPAALISRDGKYVYWPTRGGKDPQRLLRAPIS
jgi:sugar lactone lactonase YvrE